MASTVSVSTRDSWSDQAFWRDFAPSLGIESGDLIQSTQLFNITPDSSAALHALMRREGYFQMPPVDWQLPLEDMASLIARLDAAGIPVPFAFVYDEFWLMFVKLHVVILKPADITAPLRSASAPNAACAGSPEMRYITSTTGPSKPFSRKVVQGMGRVSAAHIMYGLHPTVLRAATAPGIM